MPTYEIAKPLRKLHLSRVTLLRLDPPAPRAPDEPDEPGRDVLNKRTQHGPTCSHENGCVPHSPEPPKQA